MLLDTLILSPCPSCAITRIKELQNYTPTRMIRSCRIRNNNNNINNDIDDDILFDNDIENDISF